MVKVGCMPDCSWVSPMTMMPGPQGSRRKSGGFLLSCIMADREDGHDSPDGRDSAQDADQRGDFRTESILTCDFATATDLTRNMYQIVNGTMVGSPSIHTSLLPTPTRAQTNGVLSKLYVARDSHHDITPCYPARNLSLELQASMPDKPVVRQTASRDEQGEKQAEKDQQDGAVAQKSKVKKAHNQKIPAHMNPISPEWKKVRKHILDKGKLEGRQQNDSAEEEGIINANMHSSMHSRDVDLNDDIYDIPQQEGHGDRDAVSACSTESASLASSTSFQQHASEQPAFLPQKSSPPPLLHPVQSTHLHLLRPVHPLHWAAKQGIANTRQGEFDERPQPPHSRTVNWSVDIQQVPKSGSKLPTEVEPSRHELPSQAAHHEMPSQAVQQGTQQPSHPLESGWALMSKAGSSPPYVQKVATASQHQLPIAPPRRNPGPLVELRNIVSPAIRELDKTHKDGAWAVSMNKENTSPHTLTQRAPEASSGERVEARSRVLAARSARRAVLGDIIPSSSPSNPTVLHTLSALSQQQTKGVGGVDDVSLSPYTEATVTTTNPTNTKHFTNTTTNTKFDVYDVYNIPRHHFHSQSCPTSDSQEVLGTAASMPNASSPQFSGPSAPVSNQYRKATSFQRLSATSGTVHVVSAKKLKVAVLPVNVELFEETHMGMISA